MVLRGDTALKETCKTQDNGKVQKQRAMEWDEAENGNKHYFANLAFVYFYFQFIQCLSWRIKTSIALNIFALKKKEIFHVLAEDPKRRRNR